MWGGEGLGGEGREGEREGAREGGIGYVDVYRSRLRRPQGVYQGCMQND